MNDKQHWLYVAADPEANKILQPRPFSTYIIPITREFLTGLTEKHDVADALIGGI